MENDHLELVLRAESPQALEDALDVLRLRLSEEDAAVVLRTTAFPHARPIAELAGRFGVESLLENPAFDERTVVRAWLDVAKTPVEEDQALGPVSVVRGLAQFAEAERLDARDLAEILDLLLSREVGLIKIRTAFGQNLASFPFTSAQLLRLVRHRKAAFREDCAREIATHPHATTDVWRALLGTGYMNLRALADSPGARTDTVVRERLHAASADPDIRAALCWEANGEEFRRLWGELLAMDPPAAVGVLRHATPEQLRELSTDLLLPLLESEDREYRLVAVTALGHLKRGQADRCRAPVSAHPARLRISASSSRSPSSIEVEPATR